ncbi:MAG: amidohydrolase family protein [Cyanobacteriota bacterium]|nr:amidohydrolase family protein [Cyanobacteriota bacterium]
MTAPPRLPAPVRKGLLWSLGAAALLLAGRGSALVREKPLQGPLTLASFQRGVTDCFDRRRRPHLAVVDTHLHLRPFGGPPIPLPDLLEFVRRSGVLFVAGYGIGQRLPVNTPCTYYLDCPGVPVNPSLKNDVVNAQNLLDLDRRDLTVVLSMTFPDLAHPGRILEQMRFLDQEFPDQFRWMGEVNLVKQALFNNGHQAASMEAIGAWAPFMAELRRRRIPIAIHSDLGNDAEPLRYLPLMQEVLRRYPDNRIVWMHLGLSKELRHVDAAQHVPLLDQLLRDNPNLSFDLSWRVLDDQVFRDPARRRAYVALINRWPGRFLPGTDFVATAVKNEAVYRQELAITSSILADLNDEAFRRVALGQNFFELAGLDAVAPQVCRERHP